MKKAESKVETLEFTIADLRYFVRRHRNIMRFVDTFCDENCVAQRQKI
jgi:hypothetical protein